MPSAAAFTLESHWKPADGDRPAEYRLRLTNRSGAALTGFSLCFTGPARLAPQDEVEGATLIRRLSNFTELAPPAGLTLAPGAVWQATARHLSYPLRHWSDGATAAYLTLADGTTCPVEVTATRKAGQNGANLRGARRFAVPARPPVSLSLLPWPSHVAVEGTRPTPPGFAIDATDAGAIAAAAAFCALARDLFPTEALCRPAAEGGVALATGRDDSLGPEAYRLTFSPGTILAEAATTTGFLYAFITLGQALRGARAHPGAFSLPLTGVIEDGPRMGWRGCHLDVARQFYTTDEVSRFLSLMAWNKLNRFHWHLTDDEAWRIEIKAYPALTEVGAWRGHGLPVPPLLGSGPGRTGGYYSQDAVRSIVARAASLGIETLPEIDIPGHSFAMLAALPALRDPGEGGTYASVQGFPNNCLNPAVPETYVVLGRIFDELAGLFPAKIIHIGADEVPLAAWSGSPMALARLGELAGADAAGAHAARKGSLGNHGGADAIEGSGAAVLQGAFLGRVQGMLAERGCVTGGWEEAAHGDVIDKAASYLVGWRDVAVSGKLAAQGYPIVVSPGQAYYLDMSQAPDWEEPGAGWAGWSGPRETYDFDPTAGWTADQLANFMGIQACIWSEPMTDRALFDRLVFPRLSAIAETAWTPAAAKSWDRFAAIAGLMPILYGHWED